MISTAPPVKTPPPRRFRAVWLWLLLPALAAAALAGCGHTYRAQRYKFTLEVNDNGVIRTGSAVQEEQCHWRDSLLDIDARGAILCDTLGQAVMVDLGPRGLLFALMKVDYRQGSRGPISVLYHAGNKGDPIDETPSAFENAAKAPRGPLDYPIVHLPMLVRFRDLNDFYSIEIVNPFNLEATFGKGVRIEKATVEISDEPISTGLYKILGFYKNGQLKAPFTPRDKNGFFLQNFGIIPGSDIDSIDDAEQRSYSKDSPDLTRK